MLGQFGQFGKDRVSNNPKKSKCSNRSAVRKDRTDVRKMEELSEQGNLLFVTPLIEAFEKEKISERLINYYFPIFRIFEPFQKVDIVHKIYSSKKNMLI